MAQQIRLDHAGIREILTGEQVRQLVTDAVHQVAQAARAQGHTVTSGTELPVEVVAERDTDRAAASVAVPHPAGLGMEARHGVLRKAAESAGLAPRETSA